MPFEHPSTPVEIDASSRRQGRSVGESMTDGDGRRIGLVVVEKTRQAQEYLDHLGHLKLIGVSEPNDGLLDTQRQVLVDGNSTHIEGRDDRSAAGPQLLGRIHTLHEDRLFEGGGGERKLVGNVDNTPKDITQTIGK
jgi:hypothetical protein